MEILPLKKFDKVIETAPDKSITHRAIMFNSIAAGEAVIKNALLGEDCISTIECMKKVGADISINDNVVTVKGTNNFNECSLDVGNSGTTFRLFSGILAGQAGKTFTLDGDVTIRRRPMARIINPLSEMGADIKSKGGLAPITIKGTNLNGINYKMPVASAQVKSAILLAGLNANGQTTVTELMPTRNHTELMLQAMGADIVIDGLKITLNKSRLNSIDVTVPGDISSAAYPLVLAACIKDSCVTIKNVGINPTRTGIIDILKACGANIKLSNFSDNIEPSADITLCYSQLKPFKISGRMIPRLIDEIPVLAVLACFIDGESIITQAEELKIKESNRIDTVVGMLKDMGADISATSDGMIIRGTGSLRGGVAIDSHGDHRIAMSAAVAGAAARRGAAVLNSKVADVSYPGFFKLFSE